MLFAHGKFDPIETASVNGADDVTARNPGAWGPPPFFFTLIIFTTTKKLYVKKRNKKKNKHEGVEVGVEGGGGGGQREERGSEGDTDNKLVFYAQSTGRSRRQTDRQRQTDRKLYFTRTVG